VPLVVLNLDTARFECTFGRACDGICCRKGRPPIYEDEAGRIREQLPRIIPLMRPQAVAALAKDGFVSRRRKAGQPMARVVGGWCIFFNRGCTLHQLGAADGEPFRYKPAVCAMFPLAKNDENRWYVRQQGYQGEAWTLPCLDPAATTVPARESLDSEIALVRSWEETLEETREAVANEEVAEGVVTPREDRPVEARDRQRGSARETSHRQGSTQAGPHRE